MKINTAIRSTARTHEGGPSRHISAEASLRRSVLSCLLWEHEFYEGGESIADRITSLVRQVNPETVAELAIEARTKFHLRHVPLLLICSLAECGQGGQVQKAIDHCILRADEIAELVALWWKNGKRPLPASIKKGLAKAFNRFNAYQFAKYNRDASVKLRDVMFLVHPKPDGEAQAKTFKSIADKTLASPDTWEVALSAGKDKKETFERLIREGQLGYLALLRNLRNMAESGVDPAIVRNAILTRAGASRVLPFRYVAAARACPQFEPELDLAMMASLSELPTLSGKTIILVDVSASMDARLSSRGDLTRMDAAAALASIVVGDVRIFTFSYALKEVPPRKGMAGIDAIVRSQSHSGTLLGHAVGMVSDKPHDRLIVITDEQSEDSVPNPVAKNAYLINVASCSNGVGYGHRWTHIDGFSENVIRFIVESEACK